MSEADRKSGAGPIGQPDDLSATGMFRSVVSPQSNQPQEPRQEGRAKPAPEENLAQPPKAPEQLPSFGPGSGNSLYAELSTDEAQAAQPGEFTKLFQNPNRVEPLTQPMPPTPASSVSVAAQETAKQAPGDFTRIFVRPPGPSAEQPSKAVQNATPAPAGSRPPGMKGFSSPGVSDSASAEACFTKVFRTPPSSSTPTPEFNSVPVKPGSSPPSPEETEWTRTFDSGEIDNQPYSSSKSAGATELFRALSPANEPPANQGAHQPLWFTSSAQNPLGAGSTVTPDGATMLMQKLSDTQAAPRTLQSPPFAPASTPHPIPASGPGEFTRILSGDDIKAAVSAPGLKAAVPSSKPEFTPVATTFSPEGAVGALHAPASPAAALKTQAPVPPKIAAPNASPAALPQSKLQELMPILLLLNTVLLIILIVLVIVALKPK